MRQVHVRFQGKPGTLAQYGDSITVTMAYLAGQSWRKEITAKNMTPEIRKEMELVGSYSNRTLWREWKGGRWGNTGMMKSDWLFRNIDGWQKRMQPECATIMFGTNDIGRIWPPQYTEYMAASLRRMMEDGTVPMLNSIPPARKAGHREYWLAALSIAHGLKVPLIDYHAEVLRRRPDDWNGRLKQFDEGGWKGYDVPTLISRDGIHPSNPKKYKGDWSEEALNCSGYGLRNYMTLRMYYRVISRVFKAEPGADE
ncbi:MAG: SGNH/GDSL hydrolase family protein [Planctomycetota bacterium]